MRRKAKLTVFFFLSGVIGLFQAAASVSAQTPTPTPVPGGGGIIADIVHTSSGAASWLSGQAVEYAGSPLWSTLVGVLIILLFVSMYLWMRRPKKPVETRAPM